MDYKPPDFKTWEFPRGHSHESFELELQQRANSLKLPERWGEAARENLAQYMQGDIWIRHLMEDVDKNVKNLYQLVLWTSHRQEALADMNHKIQMAELADLREGLLEVWEMTRRMAESKETQNGNQKNNAGG